METHGDTTNRELNTDGASGVLPDLAQGDLWFIRGMVAGSSLEAAKRFSYDFTATIARPSGGTSVVQSAVNVVYETDDTSFNVVVDVTGDRFRVQVVDSDGAGDVVVWSCLMDVVIARHT